MTDRFLRCGCRLCGCVCSEHSPTGEAMLCAPHLSRAVSAFVGAEAVRLVAISIFVAVVLGWCAVLAT